MESVICADGLKHDAVWDPESSGTVLFDSQFKKKESVRTVPNAPDSGV